MSPVTAPRLRTHDAAEFRVEDLLAAKGDTTVSVCIPARNEETTVGAIVATIHRELVDDLGLVDEIVVVDDHSSDRTASEATGAGARVVAAEEVLADHGRGHGKGEALWKSLFASTGDVVVWCDADVQDFSPRFVTGLLGPLLTDPELAFVKGFYERPVDGQVRGGGRVTELVARPVLTLLFPDLAGVVQPLSGEYGGRREVLEQLPFVEGYGVDIALLIDIAERFGVHRLAQVDLGQRVHRNRPLHELSPMAAQVLQAALRRAAPGLAPDRALLTPPELEAVEISYRERPPLASVPAYGRRTGASPTG
ncbi:glucosyl-3-phosphoglycerate synthase [Rhabdothermincola salaria]|uniref:glucosyl-3-phosphoglycerate synthase n=1 Tax=Rhabdothermincola salaria TaxID=2903142 RepID=UPI002017B0A1|nr:glucosyl-3-phosphoglycerate synthase [Rhabdothermincola salaria]